MAIVCFLLQLYLIALFVRIVLSWFPGSSEGAMGAVSGFLWSITEPVLAPLRSVLPPVQMGAGALDLSPIVVTFGIFFLLNVLCG
jgi:YggT family protein